MDATNKKFETFEELEVYKVAREFRKAMYAVSRKLPEFEKYELASQIRRAAVSLTNNIAEGHGRYHYLDNIRFLLQSRGSLTELIDDLNVCADENYLTSQEMPALRSQAFRVYKLLNGYVRYLRDQKTGQTLGVRETPADYGIDLELTDENLPIH